jgi:hypothetical protein
MRQWVLTTPFPVRRLLALRPDALTAAGRIFVEEIARWQKQKATARGTPGGETGSVTFVQRFEEYLRCGLLEQTGGGVLAKARVVAFGRNVGKADTLLGEARGRASFRAPFE